MYLYELIEQNKMINKKIEEIKNMLISSPNDDLASEIQTLLDNKQTNLVKISIANNSSQVNVGQQTIKVVNAVIIRSTLKEKIDLLTELISSDTNLDRLSLMTQRENYFKDYILMDMIIKNNDLNVQLD